MSLLTPEQVREIAVRAEKATPGPWVAMDNDDSGDGSEYAVAIDDDDIDIAPAFICEQTGQGNHGDAFFIAAARTGIPALCHTLLAYMEAVEKAPHTEDCASLCPFCSDCGGPINCRCPSFYAGVTVSFKECDCWKSRITEERK